MIIWLLTIGILISGILTIWFGYRQPQGKFYIFKPLTMILIILILVLGGEGFSLFKTLILAGLLFSLLGDILLMIPGDRFLAGLAAFFIAHIFYVSGFWIGQGALVLWPVLPMLGLAGLIGWILKDDLGKMKIPALAYMGLISSMVWLAWSRWISGGQLDHLLAFCGAVLFLISDLILAVNRFKVEFKAARALDLLTYYAGQWLIALSLIGMEGLGL